ncbi:MAG: excinuclease ABC subunit UvrB [bacterium]|nr:excinuclease ABC subunit UvrB [bacterium]
MSMKFQLKAPFKPTGDQPQAIQKLVDGLSREDRYQTLLGVTGSGKTFTMANVIEKVQRPTLIISHNKTLAAQLCQEFREFFPNNAVEYFVSYYDYYQPEAYVPQSDTYIQKETKINEEIDKLRLAATTSLMTRKDVIVVASVSCIYNIGSPHEYASAIAVFEVGKELPRNVLLRRLVDIHYERNDMDARRGTFRVAGETVDVFPSYMDEGVRIQYLGDTIEHLTVFDPLTGQTIRSEQKTVIYPAKHYITAPERFEDAFSQIQKDSAERVRYFKKKGRHIEAQRIHERTTYDLEMIRQFGYCNGIENYSRYFDGRAPGDPPHSLLEFFSKDYLVFIDESHITVPQLRGMYFGDKTRKETLIEFGFRLPAAIDNRPLKYEEFEQNIRQAVFVSATPDAYELAASSQVVEQLIRPTGLLDPEVSIRKTEGQINDLLLEIDTRVKKHERVLVTTLTKRMAEDLAAYLEEKNVKVTYIHADVETLKRSDILQDLREGKVDVLVGINLLREGLDLPEVSLVVIFDADKEGFLRSTTSMIQVMGRAARHLNGAVIMYADTVTGSMQRAIEETDRRRQRQVEYNKTHGITPLSIKKAIRARLLKADEKEPQTLKTEHIPAHERTRLVEEFMIRMRLAADALDFEKAARLRDQIKELQMK